MSLRERRFRFDVRSVALVLIITLGIVLGLILAVRQAVDASARQTRRQIAAAVYEQQLKRRDELLAGCKRNLADRRDLVQHYLDSARDWSAAAKARRHAGTPLDLATAREYAASAQRMRARAERTRGRIVPCDRAYPPVRPVAGTSANPTRSA